MSVGPKVVKQSEKAAVKRVVSSPNPPSRKDVVIGPDGMWRTDNYAPEPVYTRKEPKP